MLPNILCNKKSHVTNLWPMGCEQKVNLRVAQSPLTLCDPMDYTVHGILQARILEWVAFPFSRGFFPTQGSNPGLLNCGQILYQLSSQGSPLYAFLDPIFKGKAMLFTGFPGGLDGKGSTCNVGDLGSIPESGSSSGGGHGNPLQYSGLENAMDRGAWLATVRGVAKSHTD